MLVRIDLSVLNDIEKNLRKSSNILSSVKRELYLKNNLSLLSLTNRNSGIENSISYAYSNVKSIDNEVENLKAVLKKYILDAELLVYGDRDFFCSIDWNGWDKTIVEFIKKAPVVGDLVTWAEDMGNIWAEEMTDTSEGALKNIGDIFWRSAKGAPVVGPILSWAEDMGNIWAEEMTDTSEGALKNIGDIFWRSAKSAPVVGPILSWAEDMGNIWAEEMTDTSEGALKNIGDIFWRSAKGAPVVGPLVTWADSIGQTIISEIVEGGDANKIIVNIMQGAIETAPDFTINGLIEPDINEKMEATYEAGFYVDSEGNSIEYESDNIKLEFDYKDEHKSFIMTDEREKTATINMTENSAKIINSQSETLINEKELEVNVEIKSENEHKSFQMSKEDKSENEHKSFKMSKGEKGNG